MTARQQKTFKNIMISGLTVVLIFLLWSCPVLAGDKYVGYPGGADANSGDSMADSWKTLHYALANIASNTKLHVYERIYDSAYEGTVAPLTFTTIDNVIVAGGSPYTTIIDGTSAWTDGITIPSTATNITIEKIRIQNFTDGIAVQAAGAKIHRCILLNNSIGITVAPGANAKIWNNLIYQHTTGAARGIEYAGDSTGTIYHNTVDNNTDKGIFINTANLPEIKYNIITNNGAVGIFAPAGMPIDYNNVYSASGTDYSGGCSAGSNDISDPPDFEDPPLNYKLGAATTCTDKIPSSPLNYDLDNVSRPQPPTAGGLSDMGCYEKPIPGMSVPLSLPAGSTSGFYKIVSMPVEPADPSPTAIFGPQIGTYDPTKMRLGRWCPIEQVYKEYPVMTSLFPGDSFWALFRDGITLNLSGYSAPTAFDDDFSWNATSFDIYQGWNMVGNPFNFNISVDNIGIKENSPSSHELLTAGTITQGVIWVYYGSYSAKGAGGVLAVGEGGWVKKVTPGNGRIVFKYAAAPDLQPASHAADNPAYDSLEKPPAPPADVSGGWASGGGGGGGGGGCFIGGAMAD